MYEWEQHLKELVEMNGGLSICEGKKIIGDLIQKLQSVSDENERTEIFKTLNHFSKLYLYPEHRYEMKVTNGNDKVIVGFDYNSSNIRFAYSCDYNHQNEILVEEDEFVVYGDESQIKTYAKYALENGYEVKIRLHVNEE